MAMCGQNFSSIVRLLLELYSKKKIGPNWVTKKKNRCIRTVKSRTANTQKLKLMDPKAMDRWSYYSLGGTKKYVSLLFL